MTKNLKSGCINGEVPHYCLLFLGSFFNSKPVDAAKPVLLISCPVLVNTGRQNQCSSRVENVEKQGTWRSFSRAQFLVTMSKSFCNFNVQTSKPR